MAQKLFFVEKRVVAANMDEECSGELDNEGMDRGGVIRIIGWNVFTDNVAIHGRATGYDAAGSGLERRVRMRASSRPTPIAYGYHHLLESWDDGGGAKVSKVGNATAGDYPPQSGRAGEVIGGG